MATRLRRETHINLRACREEINKVTSLLKIQLESKSFSSEMTEELSTRRGIRASTLIRRCTTPYSRTREVHVESWQLSKPSSWNTYYLYKSKRFTMSIWWLGIMSWLQPLLTSYSIPLLVIHLAPFSLFYHRVLDEDSEGVLQQNALSQVNARNKLYRGAQISDKESLVLSEITSVVSRTHKDLEFAV